MSEGEAHSNDCMIVDTVDLSSPNRSLDVTATGGLVVGCGVLGESVDEACECAGEAFAARGIGRCENIAVDAPVYHDGVPAGIRPKCDGKSDVLADAEWAVCPTVVVCMV